MNYFRKNCQLVILMLMAMESFVIADSLYMSTDPITSSIFTDKRARTIGDIITIYISEASNSSQKGSTTLKKESSILAEIKSLFYPMAAAPTTKTDTLYRTLPFTGSRFGVHNGTLPKMETDSTDDFKGNGELTSSNTVKGTITAMIIEILPNGNFLVEGKRYVNVDGQEKKILISGIVRPEDIGADNSVLSQNVANAKIEFFEKGPIEKSRKVSLLKRVWDFIGF